MTFRKPTHKPGMIGVKMRHQQALQGPPGKGITTQRFAPQIAGGIIGDGTINREPTRPIFKQPHIHMARREG
jgi:hypothetical protein